ncbi:MAG: TonB family protein [Flavobacteriales bacterium]|nr:TonB family protein [Flavobacteriales bacterium]
MTSALEYVLTCNLVFALLFATYWLLLRRETFFLLNRAWLVGSAILAMVLPCLPRPVALDGLPVIDLPTVELSDVRNGSTVGPDWLTVLLAIHLFGVLIGLVRLWIDIRRAWSASASNAENEACSFLWRISVPVQVAPEDREAMMAHEHVHVRHWHSMDILLFRFLNAVNWFVPTWWMALRELRLVHEHTADAYARAHYKDYEAVLLAHALGVPRFVLTNSFRSSDIKTRMTMMQRTPSPNKARIKYLAAVPLIVLSITITEPTRSAVPFRAPQNEVVTKADRMPEFPGGMDALMKYLGDHVNYPKTADGNDVPAGTVHVQFIVTTSGAVEKVALKKGSSPELDTEAIRVVRTMPKWTPGSHEGKPVAVQMVLPIRFEPS